MKRGEEKKKRKRKKGKRISCMDKYGLKWFCMDFFTFVWILVCSISRV